MSPAVIPPDLERRIARRLYGDRAGEGLRVTVTRESLRGRPGDVPNRSAAVVKIRKLLRSRGRTPVEARRFHLEAARLAATWRVTPRELAEPPPPSVFPVGPETDETAFAATLLGALGWPLGWLETAGGPVVLGRDPADAAEGGTTYLRLAAFLRDAFSASARGQGVGGDVAGTRIPVYFGFASRARGPGLLTEASRTSFYHGLVTASLSLLAEAGLAWSEQLRDGDVAGLPPGALVTALAVRPPDPPVDQAPEGRDSPFRRVVVSDRGAAEKGARAARSRRFRPW